MNEIDKYNIRCAIGCSDHANSKITLTAGSKTFNLNVGKNCKKRLEV